MKLLMILACMFASISAHAWDPYGDLLTGSASTPTGGTVIVDSGSITILGTTTDYYDLRFYTSCTLSCTLEVGVYNSNDTVAKTHAVLVPGGNTVETVMPHLGIGSNQKVKIKVSNLNLGNVTGSISLQLISTN